jgi:rare lipoprotein A
MKQIFLFLITGFFVIARPSFATEILGNASWYDKNSVIREGTCHSEKCFTASGKEIGELEKKQILFCASNDFPIGTKLKVTNVSKGKNNGKSIVVSVLDRGGFKKYNRKIDLGKNSFKKLANLKHGLIKVKIKRLTRVNKYIK